MGKLKKFKPGDLVKNKNPRLFEEWGFGLILKIEYEGYSVYFPKKMQKLISEGCVVYCPCFEGVLTKPRFEYAYKQEKE